MAVEDGQVNPVGGTFAFVQFFQFDKIVFNEASQPVAENMVSRDSHYSEVLPRPS